VMKKIIGYLPLDDRPCNYIWPQKVLKTTDFKILIPPRNILGKFNTKGDRKKIYSWLRENVEKMDILILSMDMLSYGGLIASRKLEDDVPQVLCKLNIIEELKQLKPSLLIYAFSVLMRISITVDSAESERNWKNIFKYSKLHYKIHHLKQTELTDKLEEIKKQIPSTILENYLKTRQRNFTVNKDLLNLIENGYIDFLVYTQEDASEYGFHREEQAELRKLIRKRDLLEKTEIITGTDEVGSLLITKYINSTLEKIPKIFVDYNFEQGKYLIAPYEDCCLDISVGEHIRVTGALQATEPDDADMIFLCHNSKEKVLDLFTSYPEKFEDTPTDIFINKLRKYLKYKKPVVIADVLYSNGGDPVLISKLIEGGYMKYISSYSALNTTSNTIGFTLSLANLEFLHDIDENHKRELILERILDDCYYQTIVRPHINKKITEKGFLPLNLKENSKYFEREIEDELKKYLEKLLSDENYSIKYFKVFLPWARTFEVEMEFELSQE